VLISTGSMCTGISPNSSNQSIVERSVESTDLLIVVYINEPNNSLQLALKYALEPSQSVLTAMVFKLSISHDKGSYSRGNQPLLIAPMPSPPGI
jgi:hypothetical protein